MRKQKEYFHMPGVSNVLCQTTYSDCEPGLSEYAVEVWERQTSPIPEDGYFYGISPFHRDASCITYLYEGTQWETWFFLLGWPLC